MATSTWYVEVRARRRVELWPWWHHTRAEAHEAAKVPLLVLKEPRRGGQLLAVLLLEDLAQLVGVVLPVDAVPPATAWEDAPIT